jgi:type I restriction enzyme S subunit
MAPDIEMARLKDHVTDLRTSINVPSFPQEWFAHFSLPAFDTGRIPVIEQGRAIQSAKLSVPTDCVLLSKLNPQIPRVWFPRYNGQFRAICSTEFLVLRPLTPLSPQYLYCVLSDPKFREWHSAQASGTTGSHQRTSFASVSEWKFILPPVAEQRAIAHILGAIDDKIDLNRRMAATLEDMARALFTSWFVRFDPVRAKMAGQPTGLPPHIDALFPDALVDSELGEVPEGWGVGPLAQVLDVLESGRRPKGGVRSYSSGVPSIGAESIQGLARFDYGQTKFVPAEFYQTLGTGKVSSMDVLLYKDGGKPGEFRPRVAMYGDDFPFSVSCINEHVFRLRSTRLQQEYLYFLISDPYVLADLANKGGKAAIPGINRNDVLSVWATIPPISILSHFYDYAHPSCRNALRAARETRSLELIRDALLPKLVSGELRIPDPEAFLRRAGLDAAA